MQVVSDIEFLPSTRKSPVLLHGVSRSKLSHFRNGGSHSFVHRFGTPPSHGLIYTLKNKAGSLLKTTQFLIP